MLAILHGMKPRGHSASVAGSLATGHPATRSITNVDDATLLLPILYQTQYVLYYKTEIKRPTCFEVIRKPRESITFVMCYGK